MKALDTDQISGTPVTSRVHQGDATGIPIVSTVAIFTTVHIKMGQPLKGEYLTIGQRLDL